MINVYDNIMLSDQGNITFHVQKGVNISSWHINNKYRIIYTEWMTIVLLTNVNIFIS